MTGGGVEPGWVWDEVSDLNYAHAAHVLSLPVGWLQEKVAAKGIPCTRYGKHVRFTPADIREIRRMHHAPAIATEPAALMHVVSDPEAIRLALLADERRRAA
jgi:hypothetical protein